MVILSMDGIGMTDDEKTAACKICIIASALRACNDCQFRIGLAIKAQDESVPQSMEEWELSEYWSAVFSTD